MVIIKSGERYACEKCIKGHRIAICSHQDRPLFPVKSRGRPTSQCQTCRANRKTLGKHVKCQCAAQTVEKGAIIKKGKGKEKEMVHSDNHHHDTSNTALHSQCRCDQPEEVCICCQNEAESSDRRPARGPSSTSLSSDPTSTSNRNKKRKIVHQVESLPGDSDSTLVSERSVVQGSTRSSTSQPSFTSHQSKDPRAGSSCCSSSTPPNKSTTSSTLTSDQRPSFDPAFKIHSITPASYLSNSFDHQASSSSSHLFLLPDSASSSDQNHLTILTSAQSQFSEDPTEDPTLSNSLKAQDSNPDSLERMISEARSEMDCNCGERCQCPGCFGLKKEKGNEEEIREDHEVESRNGEVEKQVEERGLESDRTLSNGWGKESTAGNDLSSLSSIFLSGSKHAEVAKIKSPRGTEFISGGGKQTSKPLSSIASESRSISQAQDDHKSKSGEFFDNCPTLCISCKGCDLSLENPWFGIPEVDDFMSRSRESQVALSL